MAPALFGGQTEDHPPSIYVAASATVNVVPDRVHVTLGVVVFDPELDAARTEHDARVRRILAAIQELGVAAADVQVEATELEPKYERDGYEPDYSRRRGFLASKTIGVTLREAHLLEKVVTAVLQSGATSISSVRSATSELRKHRDQARRDAARHARAKAELIAEQLGARVGRARRISEGTPLRTADEQPHGQVLAYEEGPSERVPADDDTFALGRILVASTIHVEFELIESERHGGKVAAENDDGSN